MGGRYVLALDQGTSSSRAIVFDVHGRACAAASQEFRQYYPREGWVEHDPLEIWESQREVAAQALARAAAGPGDVAAVGITNQRETVVVWDCATSQPVYPAIVWQCRRTAPMCDRIRREGFDRVLQEKTGLVTDAYFAGTKIAWILENVPGVRARAERGELLCGTIDSWLIWKLTEGRVHLTDASNASRTLLFNIHSLVWDAEILDYFRIPSAMLPRVCGSSQALAETVLPGAGAAPIAGVAGDQQAALFGQQCFKPGDTKNTYGTGCFLLMNTGTRALRSSAGLLSTVAWQRHGATTYALEGSVFVAGAALQWLRDELGILNDTAESEALAAEVPNNGGVYLVPAFVGLGAPYWDAYARGAIVGLTRGSNRRHIVRAALEAMAYQTREVVDLMIAESGSRPQALRVDGGASRNRFLCQFQADILGIPVERKAQAESTALGAAYLAGLGTGFWKSEQEIQSATGAPDGGEGVQRFEPLMAATEREELFGGWKRAVERARGWAR
jgi:glycerol kinase